VASSLLSTVTFTA